MFDARGAVAVVAVVAVAAVATELYSARYDEFDIEPLLHNERVLRAYTGCFLEQGPCSPEAKDFRKAIPEALETTCGRCTPKQKQLIRSVIRAVMEKHPHAWSQLVDKYDKDKKYREKFNEFIERND